MTLYDLKETSNCDILVYSSDFLRVCSTGSFPDPSDALDDFVVTDLGVDYPMYSLYAHLDCTYSEAMEILENDDY